MGGEDDFAAFYREVYPRLIGQVRVLTGEVATAEDAVQEAFVRAASRWRQLRRYELPEAWVRQVAFRLAIDALRRGGRQAGALARLRARPPAPPVEPEDRTLIEALRRLPLPVREALVLHHCLDLPVREVAAQLGLPVGTVKARLWRGRAQLLALLSTSATGPSADPEPRHARP
jgi:RNA polymerase sigma-70 factor, ECF subfamily